MHSIDRKGQAAILKPKPQAPAIKPKRCSEFPGNIRQTLDAEGDSVAIPERGISTRGSLGIHVRPGKILSRIVHFSMVTMADLIRNSSSEGSRIFSLTDNVHGSIQR